MKRLAHPPHHHQQHHQVADAACSGNAPSCRRLGANKTPKGRPQNRERKKRERDCLTNQNVQSTRTINQTLKEREQLCDNLYRFCIF